MPLQHLVRYPAPACYDITMPWTAAGLALLLLLLLAVVRTLLAGLLLLLFSLLFQVQAQVLSYCGHLLHMCCLHGRHTHRETALGE